ncbi:MAG TPA: hypothetical protein VLA62_05975, partial [Solirubrobacterales bacterium]|nr:hypothetical protein [Solirubrobacterales bacterium]
MRTFRMRASGLTLVLALGSLLLVAGPAAGADKPAPVELPQPLTREAIRELVSRLSDAEVRGMLLAQLDKAAAPAVDGASKPMASGLAADMHHSRGEIGAVLRAAPDVPAALTDAVRRFSEGRPPYQLLLVTVLFAIMLVLGWIAERVGRWLLADVYRRLEPAPGEGGGVSLVVRTILDLLLLAVFMVTVLAGFLALYQGHEPTRELIVAALVATIQVRLAILLARILLVPR